MATYKVIPIPAKSKEMYDKVLECLRGSFFPYENVCKAVRLLDDSPEVDVGSKFKCTQASIELEGTVLHSLDDGLSIAVANQETGEWLGIAVNQLLTRPTADGSNYFEEYARDHVKTDSCRALIDFLMAADSSFDLFEHFKADCGMEILYLTVDKNARGRGVAHFLIEQSIQVARQYNGPPKPEFVSAVYSSYFSRKAGLKAGMEILYDVPYNNVSYKGVVYSDVIDAQHPGYCVSALRL